MVSMILFAVLFCWAIARIIDGDPVFHKEDWIEE